MVERTVVVKNESGLHARPAAQLSSFVKDYEGDIEITVGERSGNAKSILNLLSMGIKKDTSVTLKVTGKDEEEFADKLVEFIAGLEG